MKFNVPIGYDVPRQCEIAKDVKLSDKQVRAIVQDFFNTMNYKQREKLPCQEALQILQKKQGLNE